MVLAAYLAVLCLGLAPQPFMVYDASEASEPAPQTPQDSINLISSQTFNNAIRDDLKTRNIAEGRNAAKTRDKLQEEYDAKNLHARFLRGEGRYAKTRGGLGSGGASIDTGSFAKKKGAKRLEMDFDKREQPTPTPTLKPDQSKLLAATPTPEPNVTATPVPIPVDIIMNDPAPKPKSNEWFSGHRSVNNGAYPGLTSKFMTSRVDAKMGVDGRGNLMGPPPTLEISDDLTTKMEETEEEEGVEIARRVTATSQVEQIRAQVYDSATASSEPMPYDILGTQKSTQATAKATDVDKLKQASEAQRVLGTSKDPADDEKSLKKDMRRAH